MSEVSAEEKRRILRERRQAKLAHGNASSRLNKILNNGSAAGSAAGSATGSATGSAAGSAASSSAVSLEGVAPKGMDGSGAVGDFGPESTGRAQETGQTNGTGHGAGQINETSDIHESRPKSPSGQTFGGTTPAKSNPANIPSETSNEPVPTASLSKAQVQEATDSTTPDKSQSPQEAHEDPEGPDISSVLRQLDGGSAPNDRTGAFALGEAEDLDMDSLLKQIFSGASGSAASPGESSDFFANMMKAVSETPAGAGQMPGDASFESKMVAFQQYQQKQLNARFAIVRFVVHVANFAYHYHRQESFRSSAYAYIRGQAPASSSFTMYFVSAEIAFVSAYFYLMSEKGLLQKASSDHPISKLLSMASAVFPPAQAYQPLVNTLLVYWGGASIIIKDISLVVLLFGVISVFN